MKYENLNVDDLRNDENNHKDMYEGCSKESTKNSIGKDKSIL